MKNLIAILIASAPLASFVNQNISIEATVQEGHSVCVATIIENGTVYSSIISDPMKDISSTPMMKMNHEGSRVVVWESLDPTFQLVCVEAVTYHPENGWGLPKIISEPFSKVEASSYELSCDNNGRFYVSWLLEDTKTKQYCCVE